MNLSRLIFLLPLVIMSGCTASMHPNYSKVFYKQVISAEKIQEITQRFSQQGLPNATTAIDPFGRVQLTGRYENERQVELAFSIVREVVGNDSVSDVRPQQIKQKDWEVSASKGFAKFIDELAKKYNMIVHVEQGGENNLIGVGDTGVDGQSQFVSGSSEATQNAKEFYKRVALLIAGSPSEMNKGKRILIVGHTDDVGGSNFNADLSEQRARSVGKILEDVGISGERIYYQGAGEYYPIGDNRTDEGRAKNRRVEIVDLGDEKTFRTYLSTRRPNTAYYRSVTSGSTKGSKDALSALEVVSIKSKKDKAINKNEKVSIDVASNKVQSPQKSTANGNIDFRGVPFSDVIAKVNAGNLVTSSSGFSLFSEAHANEIDHIKTCNIDRPRNFGQVKSLKDDSAYKTSDYLPGLYGRTWYDMVAGNLVVINKVAVLRDGATPANKPELKVYSNYKPVANAKDPSPDIQLVPDVNTYQTSNGLIYRIFVNGEKGVQCMDILMPVENNMVAKEGKIVYGNGAEFVSNFKPKIKK